MPTAVTSPMSWNALSSCKEKTTHILFKSECATLAENFFVTLLCLCFSLAMSMFGAGLYQAQLLQKPAAYFQE